jgi:hypothetical protein
MKRRINEYRKRPPTAREIREAEKLAKKVSADLMAMMEAKPIDGR